MQLVRGVAWIAAVVVAVLTAVSPAQAAERVTELVSTGPGGGNGAAGIAPGPAPPLCSDTPFWPPWKVSSAVRVSKDGERAFFHSLDRLTSDDPDSDWDIYMRAGSSTTLISQGGPPGAGSPFLCHVSSDGTRATFMTVARIVAEDTDSEFDVYQWDNGSTSIVSTGSTGGNGSFHAAFSGASGDGSRVFFVTAEQLVPEDSDTTDLYERSGGTTTLLTPGGPHRACFNCPRFDHLSEDGSRIYMTVSQPLVPGDIDGAPDIYERSASGFRLISAPQGELSSHQADDPFPRFNGATADGARVYFTTSDSLDPADDYAGDDVYERSGGVTRIVAPPPAVPCDNCSDRRSFFDDITADGQGVFFRSYEPLTADDADDGQDVFERRGDTVTLVTPGAGSCGRFCRASVAAQSSDGSRLLIATDQQLSPSDTDGWVDIFERSGGGFTLVSTGPGHDGSAPVEFNAASPDLERVVFGTTMPLTTDDVDPNECINDIDIGDLGPCPDVFLREAGATTLISKGPLGAAGAFGAGAVAASNDARIIYFATSEPLTPDDTDEEIDLYVSRPANTPPRCTGITASPAELRPANRHSRGVSVSGGSDPDSDPVALEIVGVTQDEPVRGRGDGTAPDARAGSAPDEVRLRAERSPSGDGRVYHLTIQASDGHGGTCEGEATVGVRRHKKAAAVDSGPPGFDSFGR